jgi:hypothetical protein
MRRCQITTWEVNELGFILNRDSEVEDKVDRYDAEIIYRMFLSMHTSMCLWIFFQSIRTPVNVAFGVFMTSSIIKIGLLFFQYPAGYNAIKTQESSRLFIKSGGVVFVPIFIIFEILKHIQPAYKIIFAPVIVVMGWYQWKYYRQQFLCY